MVRRWALRFLAALLAVPSFLAGQASPEGSSAARHVDRVLEAYGGREALRAAGAFRLEGVVDAHPRRQRGAFVRIVEGPERLRLLIRYPTTNEIRVLMGEAGYSGDSPESMTPAYGPLLGALRLQAARSAVPWILEDMRGVLRVAREDEDQVVLEGPLASGLTLTFHVDRSTHRVIRSESHVAMGGGAIPFSTDYGDFREVGGVLFAFREETHASGVHTASVEILSVEINPADERLKLPALGHQRASQASSSGFGPRG